MDIMDGVFHGKGINKIKKEDEDLFNVISELEEVVWQEGAISRKTKKLIAIAIVASKGNVGGLEKQIRSGKKQFGITKEEVMDVLKVVLLTSGMQAFNSSLQVVYDIFE
jgi:alkylhydroperoxidase/carboxymuconolactone decarboxylase family protein YurZ